MLKCSIKIYDEAHLYFDNLCKIDFHTNMKKTIYLTATPERSNNDENSIYQLYFKNIPAISLFDENTDPHVNYIAMHFNSHPRPADIMKCKNSYGFDRNNYTNYVVYQPNFKYLTTILIDLIFCNSGKALIYVGTNSAITVVYNYILSQFPFLKGNVGIYTSLVEKSQKQQQLYNKIIISTTKSCGAASDITDLRMIINLAEPFKSSVLAKQTLGRCRADNTVYIDVIDQGFYFTKNYYKKKKPIFSIYAKSCKDIVFTDEELEKRATDTINKFTTKQVVCNRVFKK